MFRRSQRVRRLQRKDIAGVAAAQSECEDARAVGLLIACDICLYREGLALSIGRRAGLQVLATAADSCEALALLRQLRPAVLLMDMTMEDSMRLARSAAQFAPECRIVALAVRDVPQEVLPCAEAGVLGYVPRGGSIDDLVDTIDRALHGEVVCSPRITSFVFRRLASVAHAKVAADATVLTRREREIVRLVDEGLSNKEISRRLHIEVSTVKNHIHNILSKLQVSHREAAAALVRGAGF